MSCDRFRDALSARMDGEPVGLPNAALDAHLAACTDCARWADAAAQVTRLVRLDARPVPDLSDEIAARVTLPVRRLLRRRQMLRVGLALVAMAQLAVGLPAVLGDSIGMVMSAHATHEAAAWNLALAVAFGAAVVLPQRAAGLIPLLGTFLGVLVVLSMRDYAAGSVSLGRLSTHVAAVLGLALLVAVDRTERALPPSGHAARTPGDDAGGDTTLRTVA